jgi:tRNA(Ile)-lysidine synthase
LYREDKSNSEIRYTRNKLRHLVIPVLKEINPSIEATLSETACKLAGTDEILSDYINGLRSQLSVKSGETIIFNVEKLTTLKPGISLLFELFSPFGITSAISSDLTRMLEGSTGKQIFTKTHRIIRSRNELIVTPLEPQENVFCKINSPEDLLVFPGIVKAGIIEVEPDFKIPDSRNIACIDFEKIRFPLLIRTWEKGDYFFPLGMNKKKKLSDYFIDRKYSLVDKEKALILESEGNIVWIIGERLDDRYKLTESTSRILIIESRDIW